ncbi:MAG: hypothetical protein QOI20_1914 [Acidimicrobiaceae bacterium]|jgi:hypothetical protein|nr:hypothetical protein [Acidimicrobiaceae bacterium]
MITGWLVKIVLVVALIGLVAVEGGSPLITRAQVDGTAHDAADDAAAEYFQHHNADAAKAVAQELADKEHAAMPEFSVDANTGTVHVKLEKQARSLLLKKWSKTKSWFDVRVTAESTAGK